jgi:Predicted AAA-ATPase.
MNMLKYFFEYGCDDRLFEGLEISKEQKQCADYMGKYPVISVTLKGVSSRNFDSARGMLCTIIGSSAVPVFIRQ